MNTMADSNRRVLVIDDNRAIHGDFRKILEPVQRLRAVQHSEAALFGEHLSGEEEPRFRIDSAFDGAEGINRVRQARQEGHPFAVAFVDVAMPPGMDGLQTIAGIWEIDPEVQIVLCTAHADCSAQQIRRHLPRPQQVVFLRKPFDALEVLQLAESLSEKWGLVNREGQRLAQLERKLSEHMREAAVMRKIDAQLAETVAETRGEAAARAERMRILEQALGGALESGELTLHYQPLVDIASRRLKGLEALLRWRSPALGNVSPAEFIPIAEANGMILPLGAFVMQEACAQVARWQREGIAVVPVAINVSATQLARRSFRDALMSYLHTAGLQPHQIVIELTESTLMEDAKRHIAALESLRRDGIGVAIDDFGTGYSSLSYLRNLPIDTLKIDRSFIRHIDRNPSDEAIVGAILGMSRALGLEVIAEGVETAEQLDVLARHGCTVAQGYYFGRPVPEEQCRELLVQLGRRTNFTDTLRLRTVGARYKDSRA